jgi:hypothetical protein
MPDVAATQADINAETRRKVADLLKPVYAAVQAGAVGEDLQSAIAEQFDGLKDIVFEALEGMRKAGILQPCANLGDRDAPWEVKLWDDYVANGLDPASPQFEEDKIDLISQHSANLAMMKYAVDGRPVSQVEDQKAAREYVANLELAISDFITSGRIDSYSVGRNLIDCSITGNKLLTNMENWQMVLADRATGEPVEALRKEHRIRHMTIEVPSGILVLSDGSIDGFNRGLKSKFDKRMSLNSDAGLDMHTQMAIEHAGVAEIWTGDVSPDIWNEGGLIRLGSGLEASDGSFITDRHMAAICDVDLMADVMFASGEYESLAEARRAIDEHDNLAVIRVPEGQTLHLYAPNGDPEEAPDDLFARAGTPQREGIEDHVLISFEPLDLDPEWVVEVQPQADTPALGF